jgi:hypothetical protein
VELPSEIEAALERLHGNESLTANLIDTVARSVLAWAEEQIIAGAPYAAVVAGVRAANHMGTGDAEIAVRAAAAALAQTWAPDSPPASPTEHKGLSQPGPGANDGPADQPM